MPETLRRRSDAAQLVDKYLWTMSGENAAGDPTLFHDGGNGYGLMADRVSRTPPGTPPDVQIRNGWDLVAKNPRMWTDWGEGSSYQGKAFGALGVIAPYDSNPDAVHPTQGGAAHISPPDVGDQGLASATTQPQGWEPPAGYASSSDVPLIEKLRIAREKRLRDTGYIPPLGYAPSGFDQGATSGSGGGGGGGDGGLNVDPAQRSMPDTGLGAASDVFNGNAPSLLDGNVGSAGNAGVSLYDPTAPGNTGDVPFASGQGQPGTIGVSEVMRRAGLNGADYGSKITGALTGDLPGADTVRGAVSTALDTSVPGTRGLVRAGNLAPIVGPVVQAVNTVKDVAGLAGVNTPTGGDVVAAQIPTTPLDIGLQAGPGNIIKGARLALGLKEAGAGIHGAEDVLSIIGRDPGAARKAYDALRAAGHTDEEIASAFGQSALDLAKGGAASARGVGAATELTAQAQEQAARTTYETVLKDTGSVEMATAEARKAAGAEAGATTDLRNTASELSARMGSGVVPVEPDKLRFTLQPEDVTAGQTARSGLKNVPTKDFPPIAGVTESNGTVTVLDGQTRAMLARQRGENIAVNTLSRPEYDALSGKFDMVELSYAAHRAAGATPEELRQTYRAFPNLADRGERAFKELDALRAADTGSALSREADALDAAVRPNAPSAIADIATAAKRLGDPASEIRRQLQQGGGQPDTVNAARGNEYTDAANAERQARVEAAAREADQAAIAARTAEMAKKGGGAEAVVQASRDRLQQAQDAAEQTRIDLEKAQEAAGLRQQAGEARVGNERMTAQEIADHQARVEAADLANRKAAWEVKQAQESAMAEAKGYHEGGVGKEIVGLLNLPRALSLSSDIGTARDLGLFVGTREGRQAFARGGAAGLKSVIHSDADARLVIDEANKGSRWFEFASDAKNLPGERPYHAYDFGAGASSASRVPEMSGLNESKISQVVEKYHPGIKFSDRALAVQRNVAGVDLLESRLNEIALKYGVSGPEDAAKNARFLSEAQSTIDSVNHLRGYSGGSKAKALGALNALTSPQQLISRLQVLGDPINFAVRGDTEAAKFAAKSLMGFATSQGALMALAGATGGPGRWSVNMNPGSSDFGTLRIGNTRIDTLAGLGPTMRLAAKGGSAISDQFFGTDYAKNQAEFGTLISRWLENKESPVARMVTDYVQHNKLPDENTAINMLAPSIATGFMQSLQEEQGANKALAVPTAAANFVGLGTNTYKTAPDVANEIAQQRYSRAYDDLTRDERISVIGNAPATEQKALAKDERKSYEADVKKAGLQDYYNTADKAKFFREHPEFEAQSWYFDRRSLQNADSVDKVLSLNVPGREVKYAGNSIDIARDEKTRAAWDASKDRLEEYQHTIIDKNRDATAQRMYKKSWMQLSDTQRSSVVSNIHDSLLNADRESKAWMYWWGVTKSLKGDSDITRYRSLQREYGPGADAMGIAGSIGTQFAKTR